MKAHNLYSNKTLLGIRIFSAATLILLLITTSGKIQDLFINNFYKTSDLVTKFDKILNITLNTFIIISAAILIVQPYRFFLISLLSLFYSLCAELFNTCSFTGFLMLFVAISSFCFRINFRTHKKLTLMIFIPVTLFEIFFQLTKGMEIFWIMTYQKLEIVFTVAISSFFFCQHQKQNTIRDLTKDKVLNLAAFKGLERSDLYLLEDVMNNLKYKEIAKKINGSEGALRNKLSKIYKILEVGDKIGFLTIYSGYKLIYEPDND